MSTPTRGVIHDLGYRKFAGERRSGKAVGASLFLTSLKHCFGFGRSGKAKIVPWALSIIMLVPALVLSGIIIQLNQMSMSDRQDMFKPLETYTGYPYWTQFLVTVFVAAQAPVLFARDLRYRTIVLYFARPLARTTIVLTRLFALTTAVFAILAVPMTLWYVVAMSSNLSKSTHTKNYLMAMLAVLVLSLMLAAISGMVSALTTRTGLSVMAVIVALMVSSGVVTSVLALSLESEAPNMAKMASAASPFTAVAALISGLFDQAPPVEVVPVIDTAGWTAFFIVACWLWIVVPTMILVLRTLRKASL